ncbi:MAG: GAF domain-containing protein [Candidatus Sulfotelmatobacter sp.]|jgi:DNA-binding response OmpR family regulator
MSNVCKILIADADRAMVLQLATLFRQRGWDVLSAGDAVLAQSIARKEFPNAIVLGNQLPGGGATALLERIRASVHTVVTPVIVIANARASKRKTFIAAGANEYFEKPIDPITVCDAIQKHLSPEMPTMPVTTTLDKTVTSPDRMATLAATDTLDSAPSKLLDSITRIATRLVGVPTALLSIVDKDRQFFKSQVGLPEPWASTQQTPLTHSFCQWAVSDKEELIVEDATKEHGLISNLAIRDLGIVSYAGIPVFSRNGVVLGSFWAIDFTPRVWKEADLANLRNLARMSEGGLILDKMLNTNAHDGFRRYASASVILNAAQILLRGGISLGAYESGALLEIIEQMAQALMDSQTSAASA